MIEPVIEFRSVSKSYSLYHPLTGGFRNFVFNLPKAIKSLRDNSFLALHELSFTIAPGEAVGIIGRNGAGKSTLLGLVAGVLKPSAGQVIVRERVSPLLELGGGFHPDLTGRDNIMLNGVLLGLSRARVRARLSAILEFAELGEFADQPIRTYSSGMLARLGFSVITQLEPALLIVDEVLAVGDQAFREKCYAIMEDFRRRGVTILVVSHAADEVQRLCDRAIWIDAHGVRMDGRANQVTEAYTRCYQ